MAGSMYKLGGDGVEMQIFMPLVQGLQKRRSSLWSPDKCQQGEKLIIKSLKKI